MGCGDERRSNVKEPTNARKLVKGTAGAILLSALAAFVVLQVTARGEDWRSLFQVDLSQLTIAGCLVGLGWVLDAVRIQILAAALGGQVGFLTALRITLVGAFAACVTPFDTGGEPLQVYLLHKQGFEPGESTAIVTLKSLISAMARLFLVLLIPAWYLIRRRAWALPKGLETALYIGLLVYISFFGLGVFFAAYPEYIRVIMDKILNNKFMSKFISKSTADTVMEHVEKGVRDFRAALTMFLRERRSTLILISILSLITWAIAFFIPILILQGLGVAPPFAETMAIAGIFYLAAAYAPTPGSSGAAELSLAALFGSIVPFPLLGVFVLLWRSITYYLTLIVGGVTLLLTYDKKKPTSERDDGERRD
jgi:uncharacterized protein (TIRG00374 family)